MTKEIEIGIFCVGQTKVDKDEVRRWLDFIGADEFVIPDDGAISNPALLVALAGKRCYKSYVVGLNPNISKIREEWVDYFDNILASGHGSVLEHSVFNFAFENISRVFTGEMNRHRAGWAISEGSMRFIRYSEGVPYWIPDSIKGGDVSHEDLADKSTLTFNDMMADVFIENGIHFFTGGVAGEAFPSDLEDLEQYPDEVQLAIKKSITRGAFRKAFGHQTTIYKIMERVWAKELAPTSKFKGKKEITSMMRRVIGMGVSTGGMWSGNVRALRHVITMRAEPAAEEEILHVFSRVAKMMVDREPLMFGDFKQDDQGFWRPKYRKV